MNINKEFTVWCTVRCLRIWENAPCKPREVVPPIYYKWLDGDDSIDVVNVHTAVRSAGGSRQSSRSLSERVVAARNVVWLSLPNVFGSQAQQFHHLYAEAVNALGRTIMDLKLDFVRTWTDEQLGTTDPDWIEYATIVVMERT